MSLTAINDAGGTDPQTLYCAETKTSDEVGEQGAITAIRLGESVPQPSAPFYVKLTTESLETHTPMGQLDTLSIVKAPETPKCQVNCLPPLTDSRRRSPRSHIAISPVSWRRCKMDLSPASKTIYWANLSTASREHKGSVEEQNNQEEVYMGPPKGSDNSLARAYQKEAQEQAEIAYDKLGTQFESSMEFLLNAAPMIEELINMAQDWDEEMQSEHLNQPISNLVQWTEPEPFYK
ncbi:hypothetical protein VNI00_011966 [Paramarasmius palmivorus]|uniref:Uncharacterized protein n=1 Tax=Paramarasmius palmivorus TaxID=297713 RepID=A0AAW0C9N8_9AGAR